MNPPPPPSALGTCPRAAVVLVLTSAAAPSISALVALVGRQGRPRLSRPLPSLCGRESGQQPPSVALCRVLARRAWALAQRSGIAGLAAESRGACSALGFALLEAAEQPKCKPQFSERPVPCSWCPPGEPSRELSSAARPWRSLLERKGLFAAAHDLLETVLARRTCPGRQPWRPSSGACSLAATKPPMAPEFGAGSRSVVPVFRFSIKHPVEAMPSARLPSPWGAIKDVARQVFPLRVGFAAARPPLHPHVPRRSRAGDGRAARTGAGLQPVE